MPRQSPPALPPAAGRERILEAALPLFVAAGFSGVSMREVATAAGMTPAALYYHFPDKEQLYLAVIAHLYNDRIPQVIAQMTASADPWQRLEHLVGGIALMNATEPRLLRLAQWVMLDTDPARQRQLVENVFRPFLDAVTQLAADLGGAYDPYRLCLSVLGLVMFPFQAAVVTSHLPGFSAPAEDPDAFARHVVQLLRHGLTVEMRA